MGWRAPALGAAVAALALGGCYWGSAGASADGGGARTDGSAASGGDGGVTGVPCDVAQVLASSCLSCHSSPPTASAPMSLVSYEDLTAASLADSAQTNAQRSVARMQDQASPMPPGGPTDPTGAAVISAWIAAGYPRGSCGGGDGGIDPFATAPTCTSGQYFGGAELLGANMHPGGACISCHQQELEGPRFAIAGTVYSTGHEYDDCAAAGVAGAQVVITDGNGGVHTLGVNAVGNFYYEAPIPLPYTAKVVYDGRQRVMASAQQSGDCNSCHTLQGANGAPGRILLP